MEFLFFLIISGIFWFIQNKFGDGQQQQQQRPPTQNPPPGQRHPPQSQPVNEDARTQRIQEEIRRKIAERRGQAPPLVAPPSAPPPVPEPQSRYEAPPVAHAAPAYQRKELNYGRPHEEPAPAYEPPPPGRDYEAELAEQQRILAESEVRASAARERAQAQMAKIYGIGGSAGSSRQSKQQPRSHASEGLARRVRENLRNPEAAREAFLYLEILGTPVGQRRNGGMHPSWES